jgi:hypothetical protein
MKAETFLQEGHWLRGARFPDATWNRLASDPNALQNQSPLTRFIEHFFYWAWLLKIKENL